MKLVFDENVSHHLVLLGEEGARVLRLDLGNCTTDEIEQALRAAAEGLPAMFEANRLVAIVRV